MTSDITFTFECPCGAVIQRRRGQAQLHCAECDQEFNAFGQRLRRDWRANPSIDDEDLDDLTGDTLAHL